MRFASSRTVQSFLLAGVRNLTWRPGHLSSFSVLRSMEARVVVSTVTAAVMIQWSPSNSGACAIGPRTQSADFPAQYEKYRAAETQVFQSMARLDPVYMGRKSKNDIAFKAGDVRSTYDEELLEKSSDAGLRVERARKKLYEKLLSEGGTREQLQNAMLHYFLACKITVEEAGDLILEDEKEYFKGSEDILRDGPPVYTSKDYLPILTVNLGNFIRGRKKMVPAKFREGQDQGQALRQGQGPEVRRFE